MSSLINTRYIEKELTARGLVPPDCRLLEVRIEAGSHALVIRYEVFVRNDRLGAFAEALKAASDAHAADEERHRLARSEKVET